MCVCMRACVLLGCVYVIIPSFLLQVHIFSYQCSQLSTPESVIEVFKVAEKFQAKQDIKQYVSVVVLDEVGLAEDSPSLPLKALHPLLEDGTEGSAKGYQHKVRIVMDCVVILLYTFTDH